MKRLFLLLVAALALFVPAVGHAADVQHGVTLSKGCVPFAKIGDPYTCAYGIRNDDQAHDTLTITVLTDTVLTGVGNVYSGNILGSVGIITAGGVTCAGGSGNGSSLNPYVGVTSCTLPYNAAILTQNFAFYTVQAGDFNLPSSLLTDTAEVTWSDLCDDPAGTGNSNCDPNPPNDSAHGQTLVLKLDSSISTAIHDAAHQAVTVVAAGTNAHDFVLVAGQAGAPNPTGNVTIDWFLNGSCSGAPAVTSGTLALNAAGAVDASTFNFTVNSAGHRTFRANYAGDGTYTDSTGACEPLTIVDASIQVFPSGTEPLGTIHSLTGHVNVNDGNGFVNAPDGTVIGFTIDSGPGSFVGASSCTTSGGSGSCSVSLSAAAAGTTTVSAHATVSVAGVSLIRHTNGTGGNSAPAFVLWVNSPPTATVTNGQCSTMNLASGTINLTLADDDADPLTLTRVSNTNTTLLPNSKIVLGGSGNNRTLTVTGAAKQKGTATLTFNLSDGTDTVAVGVTVKIGSDQNETLNGTSGIDMIFGLAGRNTINGLGGNDLLCGGNSADTLSGGDGDDFLDGQNGDDILSGGNGNDRLQGGRGADRFSGGAGTDVAADFNPGQGDTTDGT